MGRDGYLWRDSYLLKGIVFLCGGLVIYGE